MVHPRKPKQRAFAPKVRTGCLTCKKRRKKCDEERPFCRRCIDGDYVCDGYEGASSALINTCANDTNASFAAAHRLLLPKLQPFLLPGNDPGPYFRHHFFTIAVQDLMDIPGSARFWNDTVVTLHHQSPYIQPALTALGAAHWLFLTRAGGDVTSITTRKLVTKQYNEAITSLIPYMQAAERDPTDLQSILTCCLLFILLETLQGDQTVALRHLEAGAQLLYDHLCRGHCASQPELQMLASVFHTLGNQATLFSEDKMLPDLEPFFAPEDLISSSTKEPYSTLDEASFALDRLDSMYNRICWAEENHCGHFYEDDCHCPSDCECLACIEWGALDEQVLLFSVRFAPMKSRLLSDEGLEDSQRQMLQRLQLVEECWLRTIADEGDNNCDDEDVNYTTEEADRMFALIKDILKTPSSRPIFSLAADVIPAIIDLYQYSPGVEYRQKAIELLSSHSRQELVFNSAQVAGFLEDDMAKLSLGSVEDSKNACLKIGPSPRGTMLEFVPRSISRSPSV